MPRSDRKKGKTRSTTTNPGGLQAKDLRALRKHLEQEGLYHADELFDATAQPGAATFDEFLLWLALQPATTPSWEWMTLLEPLWTPDEARQILVRLPAVDGWNGTEECIRTFIRVEALDVSGFATLVASKVWPDSFRLAFSFMAWLRGEAMEEAMAMRFAEEFARHVVRHEGLLFSNWDAGRVPCTARDLGQALVGEARWRTLLVAADKRVGSRQLARVPEIFVSGDWRELVEVLVEYDRKCAPADELAFVELLAVRNDPDDALVEIAARLRAAKPASAFADLAELTVATRSPARAAEVAARLWFASAIPFAVRASRHALAALSTERRREVMRIERERPDSEGRSVVGLADDFDAAVLDAYLGLSRLDGHVVGMVGARALETIEARLRDEDHPTQQLKLAMAFISALSGAAADGVTLTPGQLDFVARYPASHPAFKSILAALTRPARDQVWRVAARENTKVWELCELLRPSPPSEPLVPEVLAILVEKLPNYFWSNLPSTITRWLPDAAPPPPAADPAAPLRAASAAISGETTRIYVLEMPAGEAVDGELTRLGKAPVRGDRMRHLLSIDLDEVPELKTMYPDARVLELHIPRVTGADLSRAYGESALIAHKSIEPLPGGRLKLHAVDVPTEVFDADARRRDDAVSRLASLLASQPGFVLGAPITIQGDDDGPGHFVMQLDDSIGINLGDCGGLYVFTEGATWDCA